MNIPSRYGLCYNCTDRLWCPHRARMAITDLEEPKVDKNGQVVECKEYKVEQQTVPPWQS